LPFVPWASVLQTQVRCPSCVDIWTAEINHGAGIVDSEDI
jgi:hypothetical protein